MTRILHFPVSEIGGGETVLLNLIRFRQQRDVEHRAVVAAAESGPLGEALTRLGVPWQQVPRGRMLWPGSLWRVCRQLRRIVWQWGAEVVLTNSPQGFLYARWATLGLRIPVALYYMTVPQRRLWQNGPLDILAAKSRPAVTFTASEATCRLGPTRFPWFASKALAARRALITNCLSGTCELLVDGHGAVIVKPNDPTALGRGIIQVLSHPEKARLMAQAGHCRYLVTCMPAPMVQTIETALVDLSERSRAVVCAA